MRKFIIKSFVIINVLIAIVLLLSYSAKFIAPSWSLPIALLGLAYPYILLIFVFSTLLFLLMKKFKWFIINLLVVFIGWSQLSALIQFNNNQEDEYDFRIMSYNVKLFDLYNWKKNKTQKQIFLAEISEYKPDIVCFQEFYYDNKQFPIDSVAIALEMPYFYVAENKVVLGFQHFGQAIFSKYPIVKKELIRYPETTNMSLYCDVEVKPNKIIRVYSNHMESYRFQSDNFELMDDIKQHKGIETRKLKSLYKRIKKAMVKRTYQAEKIAAHVSASQYPVIVTGDFNDTPNSFVYQTISNDLKDAFVESGFGISNTYNGFLTPLRIDYILYNEPLETVNYQRLDLDISDHYPIIADFLIKK